MNDPWVTLQEVYKVYLRPIHQKNLDRISEDLLELENTVEMAIAEQAALLSRLSELPSESSVNRRAFAKNKKWWEQ